MDAQLTCRAFTVFGDALDIDDPAQRETFVTSACENDTALLAEVRKLLRADAAECVMPTGGLAPTSSPMPKNIGRYRIVDLIGQGGMVRERQAQQKCRAQ